MNLEDFEEFFVEIGFEVFIAEEIKLEKENDIVQTNVQTPSGAKAVTKSVSYDVFIESRRPVNLDPLHTDTGPQLIDVKITGITEPKFITFKRCSMTRSTTMPESHEIGLVAEDMVIEAI